MFKKIIDKLNLSYSIEESEMEKNKKESKQKVINEVVDGLRLIGYRKDRTTKFYMLRLDEEKLNTKLVMKNTKVSTYECTNCDNGYIVINELEVSKFELQGDKKQIAYQNERHLIGTSKLINMFKTYDIIGYQTKKMKVLNHELTKAHIEDLNEIEVKGRVDAVYNSSGDKLEICVVCGSMAEEEKKRAKDGIIIKHEDWDGSDIFKLKSENYIFVTDKFKNMIEKEKVKEINLEPIETMEKKEEEVN